MLVVKNDHSIKNFTTIMPLLFPYPVFHFGFGFFLKAKIVSIYLTAPVLVLA